MADGGHVLRRPDLLNSKGKLLITKARLETVWTRLADCLSTVVADNSMITISPEYAGHFYDLYINGKENAKLTGRSHEAAHADTAFHGP